MEYKIVKVETSTSFSGALTDLENKVNKFLKEGWSLHGYLQISSPAHSGYFVVAQALIKQEE